jgi:hypothetical protein
VALTIEKDANARNSVSFIIEVGLNGDALFRGVLGVG